MGIYNKYGPEVHEAVRELCTQMRDDKLAEEVNRRCGTSFTASKMQSFRTNHHYLNGLPTNLTKEEYMAKHYPEGMFEFVRDNSWGVPSADMARMCNEKFGTSWTPTAMKQFRQRHGIKSGETGWFQKGHEPGNKGKKLKEYVKDPEKIENIRKTQFTKGHRPVNEQPVGTVRIDPNGYLIRKVQMEGKQRERWEFLHRAIWEEHNGPIPEGGLVIFKDGNKLNCVIENLMLITKQENQYVNRRGLRSSDPEVTEIGVNIARLKIAAKNREKERKKDDKAE